jgi:hypothetical protein
MIPRQLIFSSHTFNGFLDPAFISSAADFLFLKDVARVALAVD